MEIRATRMKGRIYTPNATDGNVEVSVGSHGILIADDKFAPLADKIRAALRDIGGRDVKFTLNTRFHGNHAGGIQVFGPEAPIIAQTNVRKRLSSGQARGGRTTPGARKEPGP